MKTVKYLFIALLSLSLASCGSKKEDPVPSSTLTHTGEKWNITSMDYNMVDASLSSAGVSSGTIKDAGAFYFDGATGSFDILIGKSRKEDYYGFTDTNGTITIVSISQNVSVSTFSQNVIAISGARTGTTMTLHGTVTKQSLTGESVLTGTFTLTKAN